MGNQEYGLATKLVQINTPTLRNNLDTLTNATASSPSLQVRLPAKQQRPWLRTTAKTTPSSTSPPAPADPRIPEAAAAAMAEGSTGTIQVAKTVTKNCGLYFTNIERTFGKSRVIYGVPSGHGQHFVDSELRVAL